MLQNITYTFESNNQFKEHDCKKLDFNSELTHRHYRQIYPHIQSVELHTSFFEILLNTLIKVCEMNLT